MMAKFMQVAIGYAGKSVAVQIFRKRLEVLDGRGTRLIAGLYILTSNHQQ